MDLLHSNCNESTLGSIGRGDLVTHIREITLAAQKSLKEGKHLGFIRNETFDVQENETRVTHLRRNLQELLYRAVELRVNSEELDRKFNFCNSYLRNLPTLVKTEFHQKRLCNFLSNNGPLEDERISFTTVADGATEQTDQKVSKYQECYIYCLEKLRSFNWRSRDENVCKMEYVCEVEDANGDVFYVRQKNVKEESMQVLNRFQAFSWETVCKIEDVVDRYLVNFESDKDAWYNMTQSGRTIDEVIRNLKRFKKDRRFPALSICHAARSFLNGILFFFRNGLEFFTYNQVEEIEDAFFRSGIREFGCSSLFVEEYFDTALLKFSDPMQIPTPCFQSILDFQNLRSATSRVIYGLLGRTFVPLRTHDTWQIVPFIKGVASSGKSTIGNVLGKCFHSNDVGVVSSNIEEKFGLEPIADKQLWMCYEVTKKFGIDRSEFQSMVSGEGMSIKRKNKVAETKPWNCAGWMFGNEFMVFNDSSGSIARRIVVIIFGEAAVTGKADTDLERKILQELPALIVKFYLCYVQMLDAYGKATFWEMCPKYFLKTRRYLEGVTNPAKAFLRSNTFTRGFTKYMLVSEFQQLFKKEYNLNIDKEELKSACLSEQKYVKYVRRKKLMNKLTGKEEMNSWLMGIEVAYDVGYKKNYSDDDIDDESDGG